MLYSRNALQNLWVIPLSIVVLVYLYFRQYIVTSAFIWLIPTGVILIDLFLRSRIKNNIPELKFSRKTSGDSFFQSAEIKVTLRIENTGKGVFRGKVADVLPGNAILLSGSNKTLLLLQPGEETLMKYSFTFNLRGKYLIGPVNYMYHSGGENYNFIGQENITNSFIIIPLPADVNSYPSVVKHLRSIGGPFASKLNGEGWNFSGIRDYQTTDSMRWVNWKATAKMGKLQVNEFALQRASKIIIVLDLTGESSELLERNIELVLGLCEYLIATSCKVGVITIGKYVTYFPPSGSRKTLLQISNHLTNVEFGRLTNTQLFKQRLNNITSKLQSDHEILIFSSIVDLTIVEILIEHFRMVGNITLFTPDYTSTYSKEKSNPTQEIVLNLFYFNRLITSERIQRKGVTLRHWSPLSGFSIYSRRRRIN